MPSLAFSFMPHRLPLADRPLAYPMPSSRAGSLRPLFRIGDLLIACGVPRERLLEEARRAAAMGSDLIDLGLSEGWLDEAALLAELSARLDVQATEEPPAPEKGVSLEESLRLRSFRVRLPSGRQARVIAPNGALIRALGEGRLMLPPGQTLLTRHASLVAALATAHASDIARYASQTLPPRFSARHEPWRRWLMHRLAGLAGFAVLAMLALSPFTVLIVLPMALAPLFIGAAAVALICVAASGHRPPPPASLPDSALPRYSVLVPLYREVRVLDALIRRLALIDYPRDRLEILLLVEEDDHETRHALDERRAGMPGFFSVLIVPPGEPRTKPRALNAALPFATGHLAVVYDAEDAPDPGQLRLAAATFAVAPVDQTCLQARLGIANPYDGPLAWRFAVDYAALFDTIKAGAAHLGWPVPLGGTSNHFRMEALRRVGAWDAWNVTEDADLGVRLARFRHRIGDLPSTTWEEAPASLRLWMNQRTRWMKGWMQTLLVQARAPRDLLGELGPFRVVALSLTGLSVVLGALLLPFVAVAFGVRLTSDTALFYGSLPRKLADGLLVASLAAALLLETIPALLALHRRRSMRLAGAIVFAPVIYGLISFAAWRALFELIRRPYHWHKTPHGLMRREGGVGDLSEAG